MTFRHFPGVGEAMAGLKKPASLLALMMTADPDEVKELIKKVEDLRDKCDAEAQQVVKDCDAKKVIRDDAKKELDKATEEREVCTEKLVTERENVERLEQEEEETRIVVAEATEEEKNAEQEEEETRIVVAEATEEE